MVQMTAFEMNGISSLMQQLQKVINDYGASTSCRVGAVSIDVSAYSDKKGRIVTKKDNKTLVVEPEGQFPAYVAPEEAVKE